MDELGVEIDAVGLEVADGVTEAGDVVDRSELVLPVLLDKEVDS